MNEKTLKSLEKLLPLVEGDKVYLKTEEFKVAFTALAKVIKDLRDENREVNQYSLNEIQDLVETLNSQHDELKKLTEDKTSESSNLSIKAQEDFKNTLKTIREEFESLKEDMSLVRDGEDADEDVIVEKLLEKIKLPESTVLDNGDQIIDKVNQATNKISLDKIDGIPALEQKIKGDIALPVTTMLVNGKRAKNLSITGGIVNVVGDTANITVTGGGGEWGTITGTLSDQTDLQSALDAKLDGNGTATYVPFYSDANTLTSDEHFTYDSVNDVLHVHKLAGDATDGLIIESANGTDIGILGAGNTANVTWYGSHNFDTATASTIASFGASKTLSSLSTATYPDLTELSYVKGVTSAIQTQLNGKANSSGALTQFVGNTAWRVFYSDGSGDVQEVALGADGTFLKSNGAAVAPSFATPAGSGDVSKVGTPLNNQMAVWTGDGTLEGTSDFTYDGTSLNLITGKNFQIAGGTVLSDSAGTLTLSGIDALDATTEATIEAAIDTLANLTSIQGRTVTLADAGANAIFGWDDVAGAYENLTQAEARTVLGLGTAAYVATDLADLNEATIESAIDTLANLTSIQGQTFTLTGAFIRSGAHSLTLTTTGATDVTLPTTGTLATLAGAEALTNKDLSSGTNTFPTFNQNTTGSAATLTTTRTIWGQNFNGSANVTGTLALGTADLTLTGSIGATGARATKVWTADLESTNMPTVGGTAILTSLTAPSFTTIELGAGGATDTTLSRVSAGVVAIEGVNILTTATGLPLSGGTMTGNITLGENASIALDPAGSADGKYTGITIAGTAGAALAFGDLCYLAAADSRWELADADAATTADRMLGMCVLAAAADGNATTMLLMGTIRADAAFPALTIGSPVYVGETAGDIQTAIPTGADNVIRRVGYALTADELYFNPSMDSQTTVA